MRYWLGARVFAEISLVIQKRLFGIISHFASRAQHHVRQVRGSCSLYIAPMPPKKDAFADLFLSAVGSSPAPSLQSSLNNLSLGDQNQKPQTSWSNLDILSDLANVSRGSGSPGPLKMADFDPFAAFDSKPAQKSSSSVNVSESGNVSTSDIGSLQQPSSTRNGNGAGPGTAMKSTGSLLDGDFTDFTDAFEPQVENDIQESVPVAPVPERAPNTKPSVRSESTDAVDRRDTVLAGLIDIGFPIEVSNRAIDEVGPDLQACVNHIMNGSQKREERTSHSSRTTSKSPPDLSATLQDISSDIFKKASWFLDKSTKTVIKNINQLQNKPQDDTMPAWMRNQRKYKERATEADADYGVDEENIDSDEIQRIIRLQRQREKERQKERLSTTRSSRDSSREATQNGSKPKAPSLGCNSPTVDQVLPPRPVLVPLRANSRSSSSVPGTFSVRESARAPSNTPSGASRPHSQTTTQAPSKNGAQTSAKAAQPQKAQDVDLLGLGGLSRAERFRKEADESTYVSPSRHRQKSAVARVATSETLNAFQQSDFDTFKAKATTFFTNGDYGDALTSYTRCLEALPPKHELRIVITSNLAITLIKLGNYKTAKQHCEDGLALVGKNMDDQDWILNDKAIKYWYVKLLTRKAETLEMLENFPESLQCYMELVTKYGVTEKKVMDAKRRVGNIVNPPKQKPKPQPKPQSHKPLSPSVTNTEQVQKIRKQNDEESARDEMKFKLHDQVHDKIAAWANGKEDNLRGLLMSLDEVIPERLGFPFLVKKITISDLMLTKKVKINYMKVISSIHPDKLNKFDLEDQMICQAVFVALNKAWDAFKEQNGLI